VRQSTQAHLSATLAQAQSTGRLPSVVAAVLRDMVGTRTGRPADQLAWLTLLILKSGTRSAGIAVRGK
jgi:hypothetical protein